MYYCCLFVEFACVILMFVFWLGGVFFVGNWCCVPYSVDEKC